VEPTLERIVAFPCYPARDRSCHHNSRTSAPMQVSPYTWRRHETSTELCSTARRVAVPTVRLRAFQDRGIVDCLRERPRLQKSRDLLAKTCVREHLSWCRPTSGALAPSADACNPSLHSRSWSRAPRSACRFRKPAQMQPVLFIPDLGCIQECGKAHSSLVLRTAMALRKGDVAIP